MNIFRYLKRKKQIKENKRQQIIKDKKTEAENELRQLIDQMTSRPCPFNGNKLCSTDCVHFDQGGNFRWNSYYEVISFDPPKCKLWR